MSDQQSLKGAILTLNPKIVLAFFMAVLSAFLVVFLMMVLVYSPAGKLDAGTIALFAGFVTLFIKSATDAIGYQFQSSSGSDKKDDAQTAVSKALADKVPAPAPITPPPVPPAVVVAWWGALDPAEQQALTDAAATDPKVASFIEAAKAGRATADDLAYLVSKIPPLLSQDRADALKTI